MMGNFSYSQLVVVDMNHVNDILISPNPTDGIIRVEGANLKSEDVCILNSIGQDVSKSVNISVISSNYFIISLEKLPNGIYFIRINSKLMKVYKK